MDTLANSPVRFRFSSANAREMAQRSAAARRKRRDERKAGATIQPRSNDHTSGYIEGRIADAREQIERLTKMATKAKDALECERLARAVNHWSEIERVLSGRPLPGARKPGNEATRPAAPARLEPLS